MLSPMSDFVLVEVESPPDYHVYRHYQHIIVPDAYSYGPEDRSIIGRVLKKGPTCRDTLVAQQDRVVLPKGRGAYLNPTRTLMMIREEEILAVIE